MRRHVRECEECSDFRSQVRSNDKVLAALFPVGPLLALKGFIASKLGFGGASGGAGAGARTAAGAGAGSRRERCRVGSVGAALSGSGAAGGIGAIGGAIGTKAVAGVVTAAVLTAGAVEVKQQVAPATPTPVHATRLMRAPAHPAPLIAHARPVDPDPTQAPAPPLEATPPPARRGTQSRTERGGAGRTEAEQ